MASSLVNTVGQAAPEGFIDMLPSAAACSSYGWLSPRISFSHEFSASGQPVPAFGSPSSPPLTGRAAGAADLGSPGGDCVVDFEFRRLEDPVAMLPADELFSEGKLVPLKLASVLPTPEAVGSKSWQPAPAAEISSPEPPVPREKEETAESDPYAAFSPKAPSCTSRWRELLRLKRAAQGGGGTPPGYRKPSSKCLSPSGSNSATARSVKHLLHRNPKHSSSIHLPATLPLLRDSDAEPASIPSRSSSSSSAPEHEDHPLLSLDTDKPSDVSICPGRNPPRVRLIRTPSSGSDPPATSQHQSPAGGRTGRNAARRAPGDTAPVPTRSASVDSPRMNSSGKVVFQGLGRSSSSPGTFNSGPRVRHRPYATSAIRVTPVLNVPVCSLRGSSMSGSVFGLGQLFSSPQRKDSTAGSGGTTGCRIGKY